MRRLLAILLLLALAAPAHADAGPFLAAVQPGDADNNLELHTSRVTVGYLDANGNTRPDLQPDEPVYLDLDASGTVTYGDLRLSAFDTYAAGTVVNLTNRDVGRSLATASSAWFGQSGGAWFLDLDNSGTVTAGDVAFATAPAKVYPGDARLGSPLAKPSSVTNSFGWLGAGARDPAKPFYVDLQASTGSGLASPGDLRVTPLGLAPDGAPTRAEYAQAQHDLDARLQRQEEQQQQQQQVVVEKSTSSSPSAWRTLDWFVVGLAVLNVAGLIVIARQVNHLRGPPRNPFK